MKKKEQYLYTYNRTKPMATCAFFSIVLISFAIVSVSAFQFQVDEEKGWTKPVSNSSRFYNEWAAKNRFHVGDSIYFKYENDSVLVVHKSDYKNCIVSNPIFKHKDGNTIIQLDRKGLFYFISGHPGHCKSGQKMVVYVMAAPSDINSPEPAPGPEGSDVDDVWDSDYWGLPTVNSTMQVTVTSYFMTTLGVVLVVLYMCM